MGRSRTRPRSTVMVFVAAGVVVALFLAGFVSFYASGAPDGLMWVSTEQAPAVGAQEQEHAFSESTFAGYGTEGVANDRLSGAIAGVVGVAITLAAGALLFFALRGRRSGSSGPPDSTSGGTRGS